MYGWLSKNAGGEAINCFVNSLNWDRRVVNHEMYSEIIAMIHKGF